jgi:hypothetical protein
MNTVSVRTTMRPFEELEVSEHEASDLRRQGLLVDEPAPPAETRSNRSPSGSGDK